MNQIFAVFSDEVDTFTDGIDTYTEINKLHPYNYKDCIYMHKPYHAIAYVKINSLRRAGQNRCVRVLHNSKLFRTFVG